jgi:hypothetical protein
VTSGESYTFTRRPKKSSTSATPYSFSWNESVTVLHNRTADAPASSGGAVTKTALHFKVYDDWLGESEPVAEGFHRLHVPNPAEADAAREEPFSVRLHSTNGDHTHKLCGTLEVTVNWVLQGPTFCGISCTSASDHARYFE